MTDATLAAEAPRDGARALPRAGAVAWPPRGAAALALLAAVALLVYRPWVAAPFSTLDFSEFLPLLRAPGGVVGHFVILAKYFAGHGRSAWVTYAWISLNWSLFGEWARGWDLLRFALMCGVAGLAWAFLRRVGCSAAGATAGAALLVVGTPAQEGWTRLTGEPLGLAALLGAAMLALGYPAARRWPARAAAIALLLGLAVLAKEVLAVCALPVVLLAVFGLPARGPVKLSLGRRTGAVVALSLLSVGAAALLVVATLRAAPASGYAQSYGHGALNSVRYTLTLQLMGLPISRTLPLPVRVAAALLGSVAALGWALLLHRPQRRDGRLLALVLVLMVPALGAAVYLPWPRVERFYALPFLAGPVVLLGVGVTGLMRRVGPLYALLPVVAGLTLAAADAAAHADEAVAIRQMNGTLARALGTMPGVDTVFVALPRSEFAAQAWQGPGPTLRRYAVATGVAGVNAPAVLDADCGEVAARFRGPPRRVAFISYAQACGPLPAGARTVERPYGYLNLLSLRRLPRVARAELWLPPGGQGGSR